MFYLFIIEWTGSSVTKITQPRRVENKLKKSKESKEKSSTFKSCLRIELEKIFDLFS